MFKNKNLRIIIPVVTLLFIAAFAKHRLIDNKQLPKSRLMDKSMRETSGMVASAINPNIYYVHNDSGDTSRFFAITPDGTLKSTIYYKINRDSKYQVNDCEDIAVGPGPEKGKSYVYVGDVGDNHFVRKLIYIYRIEEKRLWANKNIDHADADRLKLKYPDSTSKDAETLMLDPIEKLFYVVTKRGDSVSVYTAPLNYKMNDRVVLTFRCKLFFSGIKPFKWITAGSISADGKRILLKSYEKVYYWQRTDNEPIWQTLQKPPRELPYKQEKQGEAIAFAPDGKSYYTTSEGVYAPIYHYNIPK